MRTLANGVKVFVRHHARAASRCNWCGRKILAGERIVALFIKHNETDICVDCQFVALEKAQQGVIA